MMHFNILLHIRTLYMYSVNAHTNQHKHTYVSSLILKRVCKANLVFFDLLVVFYDVRTYILYMYV